MARSSWHCAPEHLHLLRSWQSTLVWCAPTTTTNTAFKKTTFLVKECCCCCCFLCRCSRVQMARRAHRKRIEQRMDVSQITEPTSIWAQPPAQRQWAIRLAATSVRPYYSTRASKEYADGWNSWYYQAAVSRHHLERPSIFKLSGGRAQEDASKECDRQGAALGHGFDALVLCGGCQWRLGLLCGGRAGQNAGKLQAFVAYPQPAHGGLDGGLANRHDTLWNRQEQKA